MKRTLWLVAAAAVVAALVGVNAYEPAPPPAPEMAALPTLARNPQLADRIQIIHAGAILDLERRGQTWCLAQDGGYPVLQAKANRLFDQLLAVRLSQPGPAQRAISHQDGAVTVIRVLAANGAGLGGIVMADHAAAAARFVAHQIGDPREWQASGPLDAPADPMAWIDRDILPLDPAGLKGAAISGAGEAFSVDAADAAARLTHLQGLAFSDIHPAAQMLAPETGRLVFALAGGGVLTVTVRAEADGAWLGFQATAPGVTNLPAGDWVFRYPAAAATVLQPPQ